MKKKSSLTQEELAVIKKIIQLKAEKIGRPYLVNIKNIVFVEVLNGCQYIIKVFNKILRRWEKYFVCPFGYDIKMGTFNPPKSPFVRN
jgi:hypothetical protein